MLRNILAAILLLVLPAWPRVGLRIHPSEDQAIPVGTVLNLRAETGEAPPSEPIWYRFRARYPGEAEFRMVRDFSPRDSVDWNPTATDGPYDIEITAQNRTTGELSSSMTTVNVISRVTGDMPVVSPTSNELVFLYSAPPCGEGSQMSVAFVGPGGFRQSTPAMPCANGRSMNVYLAGLRAEAEYEVQHTVVAEDSSSQTGPALKFTTGALSFTPSPTLPVGISRETSHPVLFQNRLYENSIATDLQGNVIWYCSPPTPYLLRPQPGGYFFRLTEGFGGADSDQLFEEVDLAGNVILATNAARINDQLQALGKRRINSFHHEARRLPDGRILVLASNEQLLTDVQGAGEVDVIGDAILVLSPDLQVEWVWDAFDHLDVTRTALQHEKCTAPGSGCPVYHLAATANDWLHGNSLSLTPDGHILYSARHQDWVIKIDYANGAGTGQVLWRLGKAGDFQMISGERDPWFSHQHDANIVQTADGDRLVLFDNSNARFVADPTAHSRGQVLEIDEAARTVRLVFNADLGTYAFALGSAQLLDNGYLHFNVGYDPNRYSSAIEFDSRGNVVSRFNVETPQYRSVRMRDLYTP